MKLPASQLVLNPDNPRVIKDEKYRKLVQSLKDFPEMADVREIVVNKDNVILGGNMRFRAMQEAGWTEVPVKVVDWSEEKQREFIIKDNSSFGEWDYDVLANQYELEDLEAWGVDLPYDLKNTEVEEDEPPEVSSEPAVSKLGEVYQLGRHRVMCGDSTDFGQVSELLDGAIPKLCLTDPPYGLGEKKKSGKNDYSQYDDTRINLEELAKLWLPIAREICETVVFSPGVTNQWVYPEPNWVFCWFYGGGQLRSSWGFNCWQPFLCYGKDPSLANGKGGRPDAVDMNVPANAKDIDHPCPKPIKLMAWLLERLSFDKASPIYEPFCGSGSTLIACEQTDRTCYGMELDPKYVDVCRKRYWKFTHDGNEEGWQEGTPAINAGEKQVVENAVP